MLIKWFKRKEREAMEQKTKELEERAQENDRRLQMLETSSRVLRRQRR